MKIYTKGGDKGTTSLIGGRRVAKCDAQVEVYGTIDELNSHIGLLAAYPVHSPEEAAFLQQIQRCLFGIGSFYSFDFSAGKEFALPFVNEEDIACLEAAIDTMESCISPLKSFILPGGVLAAAQAHVARTVCRRCERKMTGFQGVPQAESGRESLAKAYINRLSDFLFVKARYLNFKAQNQDILY
ncbi:MAG: cob(I)yrinic acid a,c-diamide adenosyltransferase [Bacteroides sp.]|nr:cob(I)yrinic acid a,c-diamide adenosyltransferase [Ruminococcus flavefaciens]MCM1554126.1 cob(I)yrinic acid a,c-diamide adenosyltransferase [Bacteroides sp.]